MFAVCIAEIANWSVNFRKRTVLNLVFTWTVLGIISKLRPELCLQALVMLLVWIGLLSGKQSWSDVTLVDWVQKAQLRYSEVIWGKVAATLIIGLIHMGVSLPVLILMQIVWGLTWGSLLLILSIILLGMLLVMVSGLFGFGLVKAENEMLLNFYIFCGLIITGLVPVLRIINPFWQVWQIMVGTINLPLVILINTVLLLLLIVFQIYFLKQEVLQLNES